MRNQFFSNFEFGIVVLNPDFAVFDFQVENAAKNASFVLSPKENNGVAIAFRIANKLPLNLGIVERAVSQIR